MGRVFSGQPRAPSPDPRSPTPGAQPGPPPLAPSGPVSPPVSSPYPRPPAQSFPGPHSAPPFRAPSHRLRPRTLQPSGLRSAPGPTPPASGVRPGSPAVPHLRSPRNRQTLRPPEVGGEQQRPRNDGGRPRACMPREAQGCPAGAGGGAREAVRCPSSRSVAWPRPCRAPCPSRRCALPSLSLPGCTSMVAPVPARSWASPTSWAMCIRTC